MRRRGFLSGTAALFAAHPLLAQTAPSPPPRTESVATSLLLFATGPDGPWRSRDWGRSWERMLASGGQGPFEMGAVRHIVPVGPRAWIGSENGLFQSDDFGIIWKWVVPDLDVLCLEVSRYFEADGVVLMGTPKGLRRAEDGGRTFGETALADAAVLEIDWPGPTLVAGTSAGVRISADGGKTFAPPPSDLPPGPVRAIASSSFFLLDPVVYIGVGDKGLWRSRDAGKTWSSVGLASRAVHDIVWMGPILYVATDQGVVRSEDEGRTWIPYRLGVDAVPTALMFPLWPDSAAELFAATSRGVLRSPDFGQTWLRAGLADTMVTGIYTFPTPPAPLKKR